MINDIIPSLALIFTGSAFSATVAVFTRQSILASYMLLGMVCGPHGFALIGEQSLVDSIGSVGMIFLLFLAGLHLDPRNLGSMLKNAVMVTLGSSLAFALLGFAVCYATGFSFLDASIIGVAMMFSSTLLGIKLLPSSMLHQDHIGEVIISVLIVQDLLAIATMLVMQNVGVVGYNPWDSVAVFLSLPALILYAFLFERYVLTWLFRRFEPIREYLFVVAIGWCLSLSHIAAILGMSHEIGAFVAGVAIATGVISTYLAECFNPIRDFFLVLFFFSIGASIKIHYLASIAVPIVALSAVVVAVKPFVYWLLLKPSEPVGVAWESGVRLGQASEFSLIVAQIAFQSRLLSSQGYGLVQAVVLVTFIVSSYWVSKRFETPNSMQSIDVED